MVPSSNVSTSTSKTLTAPRKKAVSAGAKLVRPVKDEFYGDRIGTIIDPFGHMWSIATHIEDVSPEENEKSEWPTHQAAASCWPEVANASPFGALKSGWLPLPPAPSTHVYQDLSTRYSAQLNLAVSGMRSHRSADHLVVTNADRCEDGGVRPNRA